MISEKQLAYEQTAIWRTLCPGLRQLTASVNADVERFGPVCEQTVASERRSLVAELSFRCFERVYRKAAPTLEEASRVLFEATEAYIRGLLPASRRPYFDGARDHPNEIEAAIEEGSRLVEFFSTSGHLELRPQFGGCGIVESCEGDVLDGSLLVEVKSRVGPFEQADLRQVMAYATLSYLQNPRRVTNIALLNPHRCFVSALTWEDVTQRASGMSPREFATLFAQRLEHPAPDQL